MIFYLLSLLTGILECGWIALGATQALPLWQILCYPLAYHVGNLFPKPFSLNKNILYLMGILSVITSGITFIYEINSYVAFILTCISLFLISTVIQSVRSDMKSDGNRLLKRVFRVGGFALAPLVIFIPSAILLFSSIIALWTLGEYKGKTGISKMTLQKGYSVVMIFHQLHYFFYAHITLASVSLFLNDNIKYGVLIAMLLFCATWITYMSIEPIVSKLTSKILSVFFAGHIGISVILLIMSNLHQQYVFFLFWIITGFGGGVVYTISKKAKHSNSYDKNSMTISENIGHTLGLLIAVIISRFFGIRSIQIMLVLGSLSALLTVISMIFTIRKDYNYESISNNS